MNENNLINKGFDITTKAVSKRYPFIKGWKFTDNYQEYDVITLIDLYIDFNILSDYLNIPLDPYWKIRLKDPNNDYNTTYAIGGFFPEISPTQDDDMHKLRNEIEAHYRHAYSYIPTELKRMYIYKSNYGDPDKPSPAQPSIHYYIVYNE